MSYVVSKELITEPTYVNTNTSSNYSLLDNSISCTGKNMLSPVSVAMCVFVIIVVMMTVCGNLLVVISVCCFKQLHTPTNVLILSLAVADFFVGIAIMPLGFAWMIESCWLFGESVCNFYYFFAFQLTCVSIHNVTLIAVDRYLALSNPFLYSKKITMKLTVIVAFLSWVLSVVYNIAVLHCSGFFTHTKTLCPNDAIVPMTGVCSWVDFTIVFALPCSIMFLLYLKIFAIAKRHANAIRAANSQGNPNASKNDNVPKRSERKAAKVLGILVSVFLFCVVPYHIFSIMAEFINNHIFNYVLNFTSVMLSLNSLFNPIIYALFYPWFKKSMKLILSCHICSPGSFLMHVK